MTKEEETKIKAEVSAMIKKHNEEINEMANFLVNSLGFKETEERCFEKKVKQFSYRGVGFRNVYVKFVFGIEYSNLCSIKSYKSDKKSIANIFFGYENFNKFLFYDEKTETWPWFHGFISKLQEEK